MSKQAFEKAIYDPNLRSGVLGTSFLFPGEFKRKRISGATPYEPQKGIKEWQNYFLFALTQVFDFNHYRFKMEKTVISEEVTVAGDFSWIPPFDHGVLLFLGFHDVYTYHENHDDEWDKESIAMFVLDCIGAPFSVAINLIKLFSEFLLKLLAEISGCMKDSYKNSRGLFIFYLFFGVLQLAFEASYVLVRMVTSPFDSAKAALHSGYSEGANQFLWATSIIGSAALWTAFIILSGPFLALLAPKLITLLPLASSNTAHIALTTFLMALGLSEVRKGINEFLVFFSKHCERGSHYISPEPSLPSPTST